jgi:hypothetical protein
LSCFVSHRVEGGEGNPLPLLEPPAASCYERDHLTATTSDERLPANSRVATIINSRGGPPVSGNTFRERSEFGVAEAFET